MARPLGKRQVDLLLRVSDSSVFVFRPTRRGEPWRDMKALMKRGLVWARRVRQAYWCPRDECWRCGGDRFEGGLTIEGREAAALEKQRREGVTE